ncbi:MAG TPA: hypothetical protein V6D48_17595 [Oculatellaceae cyanobacterium]
MSNESGLNVVAYHQGRWDAENGELASPEDYQYGEDGSQRVAAEKSYNKGYSDTEVQLNQNNIEGKA